MKQKLFTLLTLLVLCVTGAWAQYFSATPLQTLDANVSFSTETQLTSTYATISGGNMYFETSSSQTAIEKQSSYYSFKMANSAQGFKIVLNQALANGDVISASILNNGSGDGNRRGIYITTSSSRPGSAPASTIYPASAGSKMYQTDTYTVTTGDGICGESTIYIWRYTSNSTYFKDFTITRPVITKVATPTFTPNGATFTTSQSVTLACATDDSSIYYTTDGTTPSKTNGTLYSSAINLTSSTTIKAIAVDDNEILEDSEVATATFTKVIATPWNSWDFTSWSSATETGVLGDATNWDDKEKDGGLDWSTDNKGRSNKKTLSGATLTYGTTITETDGLKFTTSAANQIALLFNLPSAEGMGDFHGSKFIWLYGSSSKIIIPNVPAGATVTIGIESHKTSESRQMNVSNASPANASVSGFEEKTFTVSAIGDVTINPNGKGMHIYYIRVTENVETVPVKTLAGRYYGTMVTPAGKKLNFAAVASDAKAYISPGLNAGKTAISIQSVGIVPANTPIIINTTTQGATVDVPVTTEDADDIASINKLVAGDGSTDATPGEYTYFYIASDQFHRATSGTLKSGKAYLKLETASLGQELSFGFDESESGDVTGINTVQGSELKVKGYYDLQGRKVPQPTKGLYIVNGKKVVIK